MSNTLVENLEEIKRQKDTYIKPENIKKNIQIFDIIGTLESDPGQGEDIPWILPDTIDYNFPTIDEELQLRVNKWEECTPLEFNGVILGKENEQEGYFQSEVVKLYKYDTENDIISGYVPQYLISNNSEIKMHINANIIGYKILNKYIDINVINSNKYLLIMYLQTETGHEITDFFQKENISVTCLNGQNLLEIVKIDKEWTDTFGIFLDGPGEITITINKNDKEYYSDTRYLGDQKDYFSNLLNINFNKFFAVYKRYPEDEGEFDWNRFIAENTDTENPVKPTFDLYSYTFIDLQEGTVTVKSPGMNDVVYTLNEIQEQESIVTYFTAKEGYKVGQLWINYEGPSLTGEYELSWFRESTEDLIPIDSDEILILENGVSFGTNKNVNGIIGKFKNDQNYQDIDIVDTFVDSFISHGRDAILRG